MIDWSGRYQGSRIASQRASWWVRLGAVVFFLVLFCGPAGAQRVDPRLDWREIATPRFRVVFPASVREIAQQTARIAEDLLPDLEEFLDSSLPYRPVIVVRDNSDVPGGYADPLFGEIHFLVAEPYDLTFGHRYESWVRLVLAHELTHLVHLGATGSRPEIVRQLLGHVALPNLLQPIWVWEGYAMYGESLFGGTERTGNPVYEMYLRDLALRDDFSPRHLLAGYSFLDGWPGRMGVYLYGSSAIRYLAEHYGDEALTALSRERSQSFHPVGFDRAFQRAVGKTVDEVWEEWQTFLRNQAEETARRVKEHPLTEYRVLTDRGFYSRQPSPAPDGQTLVYTLNHPRYLPGIRQLDLREGTKRLLVQGTIGGRPAFSPDGRSLVYAKLVTDRFTHWYDLFLYDRDLERERRLTWDERVFSPVFLGEEVVYLRRNQFPEAVVRFEPETGKTRVLHEFPADFRPIHLAPHPDHPILAVSGRWRGSLVLGLLDLSQGSMRWVTTGTAPDPVPSFSPDGRFLFFSDAWQGIFNLYACSLETGEVFQVTNVLSGVFEPVITGQTGYASFYGAEGFSIGTFSPDATPWSLVTWPEAEEPAPDRSSVESGPAPSYPETSYRSLTGLFPRYWVPTWEGISLTGRDPLGFHHYAVELAFLGESLGGSLSYRGAFALPEISFDVQLEGERLEGGASISFPLTGESGSRGALGLGYRRVWREDTLYEGYWSGLVATLDWSDFGGDDRWITQYQGRVTGRWGERAGVSEHSAVASWRGDWRRAGNPDLRWALALALGVSNREDYFSLGGRERFWSLAGFPQETMRGALAGRVRAAYSFPLATFDQPLFELGVIRDLTGTVFVEGGMAGNDWSALETRWAVGGEVTVRSYLAEEFPVNLTVGCAFPFDPDLVAEWYLEVGVFFR